MFNHLLSLVCVSLEFFLPVSLTLLGLDVVFPPGLELAGTFWAGAVQRRCSCSSPASGGTCQLVPECVVLGGGQSLLGSAGFAHLCVP